MNYTLLCLDLFIDLFIFVSLDSITIQTQDGSDIALIRTGIAWESDKKYKFQNPELPAGMTLKQCKEIPTKDHFLYRI